MEPERYELKALHRQLRQTLCCRCRALAGGQILPAVLEGRLLRPDSLALLRENHELRVTGAPGKTKGAGFGLGVQVLAQGGRP